MSWSDESKPAIVRANGRPLNGRRKGERTRWQGFVGWVSGWFWKADELGEAYLEGRVSRETNESLRVVTEAAEIAARTDVAKAQREEVLAQADLAKQQAAKQFFENVDNVFARDGAPTQAKLLKLAKLLESNPEVGDQVEKVQEIMERLQFQRGAKIGIFDSVESSNELQSHTGAIATAQTVASGQVVKGNAAKDVTQLGGTTPEASGEGPKIR